MKTTASIVSSGLVGVVFGVLSNYSILKGLWVNLLIWAVVGTLIGVFIQDRRYIRWSGIFYGFFLSLSFLISGFQGTSDKIFSFALLSIVLAVIGALCGWCCVFTGNWIQRKFTKSTL